MKLFVYLFIWIVCDSKPMSDGNQILTPCFCVFSYRRQDINIDSNSRLCSCHFADGSDVPTLFKHNNYQGARFGWVLTKQCFVNTVWDCWWLLFTKFHYVVECRNSISHSCLLFCVPLTMSCLWLWEQNNHTVVTPSTNKSCLNYVLLNCVASLVWWVWFMVLSADQCWIFRFMT